MHDTAFARIWADIDAYFLTPRDGSVVRPPEGSPSDRHADDRETKARKERQGMRVSNRSALTIQRLRDERTRREAR